MPDKRRAFDDLLDAVLDDFVLYSDLSYEQEFQNYLAGNDFSWLKQE